MEGISQLYTLVVCFRSYNCSYLAGSTKSLRHNRWGVLRLSYLQIPSTQKRSKTMTSAHWTLIIVLCFAAFSIRIFGLLAGDRIRLSKHSWILDDLPGLIIVSLVAASLSDEPLQAWLAALVALLVAVLTNHIVVTMGIGVLVFAFLSLFGF